MKKKFNASKTMYEYEEHKNKLDGEIPCFVKKVQQNICKNFNFFENLKRFMQKKLKFV